MIGWICIRKSSSRRLFGRPLWDIAIGPKPDGSELFGRARGIIAIGDLACGWVAIRRLAAGIVAVGGGAAFGKYVISAAEKAPEAVKFFGRWIPGIGK